MIHNHSPPTRRENYILYLVTQTSEQEPSNNWPALARATDLAFAWDSVFSRRRWPRRPPNRRPAPSFLLGSLDFSWSSVFAAAGNLDTVKLDRSAVPGPRSSPYTKFKLYHTALSLRLSYIKLFPRASRFSRTRSLVVMTTLLLHKRV